ncbi:dephospho-CoA kinase [Maribius pontilimi]|uniref:Dephospho-CoA kinase n=1 Tax=Palleronia pontilimi TaxID=1964209 RepID=A0A934I9H0_9RHOB|nr:dephospho-CoA kinase [Palleronia pontilimi]MBJ3761541.1 dephospho-CoA kinase [Palleronia pontilimi]
MSEAFLIGLTGSIGMGKSTTAQMFRDEGVPVWDADEAVHRLYAKDGAGVAKIRKLRPQAVIDGAVSRSVLKDWIAQDDTALARIEAEIHPLVQRDRERFLETLDSDIAVLDIPLLFETGSPDRFDLVAVVSAPAEIQRARVLERPGMTEAQLDRILSKQMPDARKRACADVIIPTLNLDDTRVTVRALIDDIRRGKYARNRP